MFNFNLNSFLGKDIPDGYEYGIDVEKDQQFFLQECKKYLKYFNEEKIKKAFKICVEGHKNKLRMSGQPYYTHPIEVARIVLKEIPLDETSVISALLHDILDEGDKFTINDIQIEFGNDVANIVESINKIGHIENKELDNHTKIENYRKLLLSLFKDIRIILIKLADRLHNMRTIDYLPEYNRLKLSKETLDIYAPFANRFGLKNLKWELEDLSFRQINRAAYDEISNALRSTRQEREEYINNIITPLTEKLNRDELLKKLKIKFIIEGRPKHIYSIYNKMKLRNKSLNELYDLFAIRIIIDYNDPNICFYIYGLVASIFQPVPDTFKDYINNPKRNGYQSIHTAVIGPDKKIVEVQIRTKFMHEFAEEGFAAHFRYKSGKIDPNSILEQKQINDWITAVREIFENAGIVTSDELIESVKKNLFFDEIYVYTPKNEFRTLPKDSTPLDFAFSIHSEIGYHYVGAKVNSKIAPIDYKLQSGDQVEILTSKNQTPKAEWLKYVVTSKAKSQILKFLKEEEKDLEAKGKDIWYNKLKDLGLSIEDSLLEQLIKFLKYENVKDFYIAIATSSIEINKAIDFIKYKLNENKDLSLENLEKKLLYENKKIKVKVLNFDDEYLEYTADNKIIANIKIIAKDRPQILDTINASILAIKDLSIMAISYNSNGNTFEENLRIKVTSKSVLEELIDNLNLVKNLINIEFYKNVIE